jgi:hypothetical protein
MTERVEFLHKWFVCRLVLGMTLLSVTPVTERQAYEVSAYREGIRESILCYFNTKFVLVQPLSKMLCLMQTIELWYTTCFGSISVTPVKTGVYLCYFNTINFVIPTQVGIHHCKNEKLCICLYSNIHFQSLFFYSNICLILLFWFFYFFINAFSSSFVLF